MFIEVKAIYPMTAVASSSDVVAKSDNHKVITISTDNILSIEACELRYSPITGEPLPKTKITFTDGSLSIPEDYDDFIARSGIDVTKLNQQTTNQ